MFLHISRMDCMCERASRPSAWLYISAALYHRQGEDATLLLLTCFPVNFFLCIAKQSCVVNAHTHTQAQSTHTHKHKPRPAPDLHFADSTESQRGWMKTSQGTSLRSLFLFGSTSRPRSLNHSHRGRMWMDRRKENMILIISFEKSLTVSISQSRSLSVWQTCPFFFCPFSLSLFLPASL